MTPSRICDQFPQKEAFLRVIVEIIFCVGSVLLGFCEMAR